MLETIFGVEINNRFAIEISYGNTMGDTQFAEFLPDAFFDFENYEPHEWSARLPWRRLTLEQYVDPEFIHNTELVWLRVDITDLEKRTRRRILYQYWEGGLWMFEWNRDANGCDHCCQTIAVLKNPKDQMEHRIKASIRDGTFEIVGHSFGDPNEDNSYLFDIPRILR